MPQKFGLALTFATLLWLLGFVWGSIVFMVPSLKSIASIPYVSGNPAISFPILITWIPMAYFLARIYLRRATNSRNEALNLGRLFAIVNVVLDTLVIVLLFGASMAYFASLTVWLGYALLALIPLYAVRSHRS
jgi:hypothetical protein